MMTNEQLEELRWQLHYARPVSRVLAVSIKSIDGLFARIDAQQARIAELEQKLAAAENFAGCAKAELERVQERLAASENARLEAQSIAQTYRAWAQHRAAQEVRKAYQRGKRDTQPHNP